jgi:hypothetical protein
MTMALRACSDLSLSPSFYERDADVRIAIDKVMKAVDRAEQDQFSNGELGSMKALFEAAKRLRGAVREQHSTNSQKGNFHV